MYKFHLLQHTHATVTTEWFGMARHNVVSYEGRRRDAAIRGRMETFQHGVWIAVSYNSEHRPNVVFRQQAGLEYISQITANGKCIALRVTATFSTASLTRI